MAPLFVQQHPMYRQVPSGISFSTPLLAPLSLLRKFHKLKPSHSLGADPGRPITCSASRWAEHLFADFNFVGDSSDHLHYYSSSSAIATLAPPSPPRVLGAETHFLGDGIKRAYEARVSKPPQYGFSQDALLSQRQILQAACETLVDHTPWRNHEKYLVPGALCVLQEAGKTELVLQNGESLLREGPPKSFRQDVFLAIALAYVILSRDAMALYPSDFIRGCKVLERALKLLQEEGASSLASDLQEQIDETLEEITSHRVEGATAIERGFLLENFMNEAFTRMTADEQVDLFAATPSNIPAESFEVYGVALALVARAFVGKKPHVIAYSNYYSRLSDNSLYGNPSIVDFVLEDSKANEDGDSDLPGLLLRYLERLDCVNGSPLVAAVAIVRAEATTVLDNVKSSAIHTLQKVFPLGHRDELNASRGQ
ncbi:Chaperone DnaJ-domain superfamily protein [Trema orientale]|uniref:Chaperone DnaJ-domain superfamily protein n=1 Tax=Trema orientale TaxID=63057 RepID=A0A2P5F6J3_TREOI|nr:Chaperone DnaJ-domain superfamily protein [Trema orientale]